MARNAFERDFRSTKMAASSHFVKKKLSCVLIWNGEKCDQKWFSVIQNGRWQPFCEQKSCVLIWNGEKCDQKVIFDHPKWPPAAILWKKSCVLIWNGEKCDRKRFSAIRNGRWQPFCEQIKKKLRFDLKWREMRSKVIFSHPKWPTAAILWKRKTKLRIDLKWREMRSKLIFGHPKWGGGGGGHHNGQPVNHSGIYTVFALGQIHQF